MVSGEGSSDLGNHDSPGPLAQMIDILVEPEWGFSLLNLKCMLFVGETELVEAGSALRSQKRSIVRGKHNKPETGYHYRNARALATLAKKKAKDDSCPVGAILFHDCDGTRSAPLDLWRTKYESMMAGFEAETFAFGVPMIPQPKSEAWLLCHHQPTPYQNCVRFEDMPGNDASPKAPKRQLATALGVPINEIYKYIDPEAIDWNKIDMPSFNRFKERLKEVLSQMRGATA